MDTMTQAGLLAGALQRYCETYYDASMERTHKTDELRSIKWEIQDLSGEPASKLIAEALWADMRNPNRYSR